MTAFSDDFQCAGCRIVIAPNIKPSAGDRMPVQIQRNNFTISGNSRSVFRSHAPFNIRQQRNGRAVGGLVQRIGEVGRIGGRFADRYLGNHFCVAVRANVVIAYIFVRAMVAADGADAVYQHRLFIAQVSVCVASAAVAVGNAIRFIMGIAACMRLDRVCSSSKFSTTGVRKTAIRPIEGIILG